MGATACNEDSNSAVHTIFQVSIFEFTQDDGKFPLFTEEWIAVCICRSTQSYMYVHVLMRIQLISVSLTQVRPTRPQHIILFSSPLFYSLIPKIIFL